MAIWREIKRVGAVYLRHGVCSVPERPDTRAAFAAIADLVGELGGQAQQLAPIVRRADPGDKDLTLEARGLEAIAVDNKAEAGH